MSEGFNTEKLKDIHVGDMPAAKMGIIDSLTGRDDHKDQIPSNHMASYRKGHEIGTQIENMLKGDQRAY